MANGKPIPDARQIQSDYYKCLLLLLAVVVTSRQSKKIQATIKSTYGYMFSLLIAPKNPAHS